MAIDLPPGATIPAVGPRAPLRLPSLNSPTGGHVRTPVDHGAQMFHAPPHVAVIGRTGGYRLTSPRPIRNPGITPGVEGDTSNATLSQYG